MTARDRLKQYRPGDRLEADQYNLLVETACARGSGADCMVDQTGLHFAPPLDTGLKVRRFVLNETLSEDGEAEAHLLKWNPGTDNGDGTYGAYEEDEDVTFNVRDTLGWWSGSADAKGIAWALPSKGGTVWEIIDLECP